MIIITIYLLTHLAFLILYPDTTFLGFSYIFISFLLWSSFSILINSTLTRFRKETQFNVKFFIYILMILSIASFYPQNDSRSVFDKIINEEYPTRFSIYRGLKRFGIDMPQLLKEKK